MNTNLNSTVITDKVRVSTAVIYYPQMGYCPAYYQYETFIFSKDPRVKTIQTIHGTSHIPDEKHLIDESLLYHGVKSNLLKETLNQ